MGNSPIGMPEYGSQVAELEFEGCSVPTVAQRIVPKPIVTDVISDRRSASALAG